ncbi:MAG: hypothetical protein Unbinned3138contig1002_4 [Prokaryotic dsDNA virus sp.]|nr:MAG: hypothetical protein Unbinned3138contig1002_4 [Prokaryotic dsDNA virus sp.]|tara:strand:+ start:19421 stop:21952 length:2532 start_codon:yes stop_codon:yes gene_type:complete
MGLLTEGLDPEKKGLVVKPQSEILKSSGVSGGQISNQSDWKALAAGLQSLGSSAGKALEDILNEQSAEDKAKGRALAIKHGIQLRKEGTNAFINAEQRGLFNGERPDVKDSFALHYGRNYAMSEAFNANVLEGIDGLINESVENMVPSDEFQNLIRDHFSNKVQESVSELPQNPITLDFGFYPAAEQKIQAMMVAAQSNYAKAVEGRNVKMIKQGLRLAFETSWIAGKEYNSELGGGASYWDDKGNFDKASRYYATGVLAESPYSIGPKDLDSMERIGIEMTPEDRQAATYNMEIPPMKVLPVELNGKQFYVDTYKEWLQSKVFPQGHSQRVTSIENALDNLNRFINQKLHGTGTRLGDGPEAQSLDLLSQDLQKQLIAAREDQARVQLKVNTDATNWFSSTVSEVARRWNENGVKLPNGEFFDLTDKAHQDYLMEQFQNNNVTLDGPAGSEPVEGVETFGFEYREGSAFGPPSADAANVLTKGFILRNQNKALADGLQFLRDKQAHQKFLSDKIKIKAEDKRSSFIEAALTQNLQNLSKGKKITKENFESFAKKIEEDLDREKFLNSFLANVNGISKQGTFNFSLDNVFSDLTKQLENRGYSIVDEDEIFTSYLDEVLNSSNFNMGKLRENILQDAYLSPTQKTNLLDLVSKEKLGTLKKVTDLSLPMNRDLYKSLVQAQISKNPELVKLINVYTQNRDDKTDDNLAILNAQVDMLYRPLVRREITKKVKMLNERGISLEDALASGLWAQLFESGWDDSDKPIKIEMPQVGDDPAVFVQPESIAQTVNKELNTKQPIDVLLPKGSDLRENVEQKAKNHGYWDSWSSDGVSPLMLKYFVILAR